MHQPPLIQLVIREFDIAAVEGIQNILRPRNQQPYDRALFVRHSLQDHIRLSPLQEDCLRTGPQRTHPVELRTGMIQRRDTQETVILRRLVMDRLHLSSLIQRQMLVENSLREACGSRREIDRSEIIVGQRDLGIRAGIIRNQFAVALREFRASVADVEQKSSLPDRIGVCLNTVDKLRPEEQNLYFSQTQAVRDLVGGISEVERNRDRTGFQDTEINRQPFQAVKHQDRDLVALLHTPVDQHIGNAVSLLVKHLPGDLAAEGMRDRLLYQVKLLEGELPRILHAGVQFHQGDLISMFTCVSD